MPRAPIPLANLDLLTKHPAWQADIPLFLATDVAAVRQTLRQGPAAVLFCPATSIGQEAPDKLHLVFDWDSTLVDDAGDRLIQEKGRAAFAAHEWAFRTQPHQPGPLYPVLAWAQNKANVRTSILTARTGEEAHRVFATLEAWGCRVDELHFTANGDKGAVAAAMSATLFFDDILRHVQSALAHNVYAGWVPHGTASE